MTEIDTANSSVAILGAGEVVIAPIPYGYNVSLFIGGEQQKWFCTSLVEAMDKAREVLPQE